MYKSQYDALFPDVDVWESVADMMDEPGPSIDIPASFIAELDQAYLLIWAESQEIPTLAELDESMSVWMMERITQIADEEFKEDYDFMHDDAYREDIYDSYIDSWCESEGMMILDMIMKALEYLEYAYLDDMSGEGGNDGVICGAQLKICVLR